MFEIFKHFFRSRSKNTSSVTMINDEIICIAPSWGRKSIHWNDIKEVGVLTTDDGPFTEDVFIVLQSKKPNGGVVVPQGSEGIDDFLKKLFTLPGFNLENFTKAMASTSNQKFVCWTAPSNE